MIHEHVSHEVLENLYQITDQEIQHPNLFCMILYILISKTYDIQMMLGNENKIYFF